MCVHPSMSMALLLSRCLRTAECMGIQNVWIVVPQRQHHKNEAPPPPAEGSKAELKDYRRRVRLSRSSAQWLVGLNPDVVSKNSGLRVILFEI